VKRNGINYEEEGEEFEVDPVPKHQAMKTYRKYSDIVPYIVTI
jgi:hypothetical protein